MAGGELGLAVDVVDSEQLHILAVQHVGQGIGGGAEIQQATLLSFRHPGGVVAVAVEDDALVVLDRLADQVVQGGLKVLSSLQGIGELPQLLGHGGVQHGVGAGDGLGGAQHPEFKLVAGEGEGAGPVPVRGIPLELGQGVHANAHDLLLFTVVGHVFFDGLQNFAQV